MYQVKPYYVHHEVFALHGYLIEVHDLMSCSAVAGGSRESLGLEHFLQHNVKKMKMNSHVVKLKHVIQGTALEQDGINLAIENRLQQIIHVVQRVDQHLPVMSLLSALSL